jgi:AcrR family transcriptional regulator
MRALGIAAGVSNGALYHAFGSRDGLLARVWTRDAEKFLAFQRERVEQSLRQGDPTSALVVAALAPASYAVQNEDGARLLLATDADQLMTPELDPDGRDHLLRLQRDLGRLLVELATALWDRRDTAAVTTVRYCVVNLPGTLLLKGRNVTDPIAQHALEHAVRGIASHPPSTTTHG